MTTIYLVRHARVHNPRRQVYGHLPGFGLSRIGIAQAKRLGRELRSEPITAIYTSPLQRAKETAELLRAELPDKPSIHVREGLRENEAARVWQGTPYFRVPFRFPTQYLAWITHPHRVRFTENAHELAVRVGEVLEDVTRRHPDETVVVVSHSTPIKAWVFWKQKRPWSSLHGTRVRNAEGYRVEIDGRGVKEIRPFRPLQG